MLLLLLILFGVLSGIALLIILRDYFKHGGVAVLDPEHPGRIITLKDAKWKIAWKYYSDAIICLIDK